MSILHNAISSSNSAVDEGMRPPDWQIYLLSWIAWLGPTWPVTPIPDVLPRVFKDPAKYQAALENPLGYRGKPRLLSAMELNNATVDISQRLSHLNAPFIVLHGGADTVTDPKISRALFGMSASTLMNCN